jgi:hypothetical protein
MVRLTPSLFYAFVRIPRVEATASSQVFRRACFSLMRFCAFGLISLLGFSGHHCVNNSLHSSSSQSYILRRTLHRLPWSPLIEESCSTPPHLTKSSLLLGGSSGTIPEVGIKLYGRKTGTVPVALHSQEVVAAALSVCVLAAAEQEKASRVLGAAGTAATLPDDTSYIALGGGSVSRSGGGAFSPRIAIYPTGPRIIDNLNNPCFVAVVGDLSKRASGARVSSQSERERQSLIRQRKIVCGFTTTAVFTSAAANLSTSSICYNDESTMSNYNEDEGKFGNEVTQSAEPAEPITADNGGYTAASSNDVTNVVAMDTTGGGVESGVDNGAGFGGSGISQPPPVPEKDFVDKLLEKSEYFHDILYFPLERNNSIKGTAGTAMCRWLLF